MTLPASGPISFNNINVELGVSGATQASLGQTSYRTLAGVPSGVISMSNFYGKSNTFSFSFAGGTNVDLRSAAISAGWGGSSAVIATNTGTITSASTGSAALTISGAFPGGVSLINNALIVGRGGNGGTGGNGTPLSAGTPGGGAGTALSVSTPVSITNNSTIAGGGGGGGGGGGRAAKTSAAGGGGGGGIGISTGGPAGINGFPASSAGTPGTATTAGPGGGNGGGFGGPGGAGGGYGSTGTGGTAGLQPTSAAGGSGGAGGSCTAGNVNITWVAVGTRYGALN